jgi:hypothetical protein
MLVLAVLLLISGLIFTFSLGVAGYFVGPLTIAGGGLLLLQELRRRRSFREVQNHIPRRGSWQRFLIGLGAVFVGACGLIALVWQLTAVLADTANGFFLALRAEDQAKARSYLAQDFRASTSDEELRRFVERSALADYESATWTSRSIENSTGKLEGTIVTRGGGSIPMSISFVREKGEWKILAVRKPDAGILTDDPRPQPNRADQARLASETTQRFADAVTRQDFTQFHLASAVMWQQQGSAEKLNEAFRSFNEPGIDLRQLSGDPKITNASFDEDGAFVIAGTYPYGQNQFEFRYRFIYETVDWKLVGVSAYLR